MDEPRTQTIRRVLLFVNKQKDHAPLVAEEITEELDKRRVESRCWIFGNGSGEKKFDAEGPWDLAFSLGGDGTVLYTARAMAGLGVPIMPVNLGVLGFIAEIRRDGWLEALDRWTAGKAVVSRRFMLEAAVERNGKEVFKSSCLNDAVISASGIAKLIRLRLQLDAPSPHELTRLAEYRCDGLIAATPTGSTAYSMAAGGPILDPEMEGIIINPICPFTLSNRPLLLPAGETVIIEVEKEQRSGVLLTIDGQETETLEGGDRIFLRQAPCRALLIAPDRRAFYRALRTKLSWSGNAGGEHA
jgi:NAD+ kinase